MPPGSGLAKSGFASAPGWWIREQALRATYSQHPVTVAPAPAGIYLAVILAVLLDEEPSRGTPVLFFHIPDDVRNESGSMAFTS